MFNLLDLAGHNDVFPVSIMVNLVQHFDQQQELSKFIF